MSDKRKGQQKGAQQHAEGQHGRKAHAAFIEQLHSGPSEDAGKDDRMHRHPLYEDREQHDEADKNADKTRLSRDIEKRHLDRDQYRVVGAEEQPQITPGHGKGTDQG
jgi:hypothetical protein